MRSLHAICLFLLVGAGWQTMMSPGAVGTAHEEWAADCDRCHLPFQGMPDGKCLACHEDLGLRIDTAQGWHARRAAEQPCQECHTDHRGAAASLTRDEALRAFDHGATDFALHGEHADLECKTCHDAPLARMKAQCGQCHDDTHNGDLGDACEHCHVDIGWLERLRSTDEHAVAMDGGHTGLLCEECHAYGRHLADAVPCADCHENAHGGSTSACDRCHEVAAFAPAKFDHGPCTCAFPDKHQTAACLACHEGFDFNNTPITCSGCHEDELTHEPLGQCSRCHSAISWKDDLFDHDKSKFKLRGGHLQASCDMCHKTPGVFRGAPTDCADCHEADDLDAHGEFHTDVRSNIGPCADCHTTDGWSPSSFDHASTGFALTGKHAEATCFTCHGARADE